MAAIPARCGDVLKRRFTAVGFGSPRQAARPLHGARGREPAVWPARGLTTATIGAPVVLALVRSRPLSPAPQLHIECTGAAMARARLRETRHHLSELRLREPLWEIAT